MKATTQRPPRHKQRKRVEFARRNRVIRTTQPSSQPARRMVPSHAPTASQDTSSPNATGWYVSTINDEAARPVWGGCDNRNAGLLAEAEDLAEMVPVRLAVSQGHTGRSSARVPLVAEVGDALRDPRPRVVLAFEAEVPIWPPLDPRRRQRQQLGEKVVGVATSEVVPLVTADLGCAR